MDFASKITPCLWFDTQGEEAARFYVGLFPNSRIVDIGRYTEDRHEIHGLERVGTVMTVAFELAGQGFLALNGGPQFKFSEATSLIVYCEDQAEVDYYWNALAEAGGGQSQVCGWLKDRYGLSWQITPKSVVEWLASPDQLKASRAMRAVMQMVKIDIAAVERAVAADLGEPPSGPRV